MKNEYYIVKESGGSLPKSGIAYKRPIVNIKDVQYRVGDGKWHWDNGTYIFSNPTTPEYYQDRIGLYGLTNNNVWGHNYRFCGMDGGYYDGVGYYNVTGGTSNYATSYPNEVIIDHLTGLGWYFYKTLDGETAIWNAAIDATHNVNLFSLGYTDWRLASKDEWVTLAYIRTSLVQFNYQPLNQPNYAPNGWLIDRTSSTIAFRDTSQQVTQTNIGNAFGYLICRTWY
jgi:hypothetical protein